MTIIAAALTMQQASMDDLQLSELMKQIARQDRGAFETFYYQLSPRIARFLNKFLKKEELIEETISDVMLVVWQNAAKYEPTAKVTSWVFGIAYKKALKTLEKDRRISSRNISLEEDEIDVPTEKADETDSLVMNSQLGDEITDALSGLSPEHRAVIELTFFEGFSYPEIAKILDCPTNTVKTRVFHAKQKLAKLLASHR